MNIQIFYSNLDFDIDIKKNVNDFILCDLRVNNVVFNNFDRWDLAYLVNLVFVDNKISSSANSNLTNIWSSLSSRPFKICPINKEKLFIVSNNSFLTICVFNQSNKLVGFVVVTNKDSYYWIEIFCTNIRQGVGTLIDNLIKLILTSKPIRLESTFNSKDFYLKKNFVFVEGNIMEYKKIELFI